MARRERPRASVVVLGGGLSGIATAHVLAEAGHARVTVVERETRLGGLAGSFEEDGHFYPLGYHHILHRDRTLLYFLEKLGLGQRVAWRRIRMLFEHGQHLYDLADPRDFLRFPLGVTDKLRFVRLMLWAFFRNDWELWNHASAAAIIDRYGSPEVRRLLFEPLTHLKFQRPCAEVSGSWLGARLAYREGSAPLGYIPGTNWTTDLCQGLTDLLARDGVQTITGRTVVALRADGDRLREAELDDGTRVGGDLFVSALPVEVLLRLVPEQASEALRSIRYTALLSALFATDQRPPREFYWLNLSSGRHAACAIFNLSALNPTIGRPGETCLNFVTHLDRGQALFKQSDAEIVGRYRQDFRDVFGFDLHARWTRLVRVPMYSPVFGVGYQNPPVRSDRYANLYFTGNYRTHPTVASTGTALASGITTAVAMLADAGEMSAVATEVDRFRYPRRVAA
jgi:protoporphyrinogen oxidase